MKRIEYAQLKRLGASENLLHFYSTSDPITVYERDDQYKVTGIVDIDWCDAESMIADLEDAAKAYMAEDD